MSRQWVDKFDDEPDIYHKTERLPQRSNVIISNVWGLENGQITRLTFLNGGVHLNLTINILFLDAFSN